MKDQPSNKASSPACCSTAITEVFYGELRQLPEPVFRSALEVIGELGRRNPEAAWVCHRRLFLLVVAALDRAQATDGVTSRT